MLVLALFVLRIERLPGSTRTGPLFPYTKLFLSGGPFFVNPPNFVERRITETDPGVRGDTSGGGGKPATLETGAVVRVPLFVGQDEVIKVDTRSGEYISRVK